jgi:hypothetical protein
MSAEGFSDRDSGTDWALGVDACLRALVGRGAAAEDAYREAIERLDRSGAKALLARTHLVFGEWLRPRASSLRGGEQLRGVLEMLTDMGVEAFAHRTRSGSLGSR